MSNVEANKPGGGEGNEPITVCVKDQAGGGETIFKIKKSTKMSKVFNVLAQRKGVEPASLRFLLKGEHICPDETPKTLDLKENDQIDSVSVFTIKIKDEDGNETPYIVEGSTKLSDIFKGKYGS